MSRSPWPDGVSVDDEAALRAQLRRASRGTPEVVLRCNWQLPVVVRMPPVLDTGEPFPTRYWLTCPLLHRRIARLEAAGEVRRMEAWLDEDPALAAAMRAAHDRYAAERDALVSAAVVHPPTGGVAGIRLDDDGRAGVKCLHAHTADFLAGHANPVGERVAEQALPAECPTPCVRPAPLAAPSTQAEGSDRSPTHEHEHEHEGGVVRRRWVRASDWTEPSQ